MGSFENPLAAVRQLGGKIQPASQQPPSIQPAASQPTGCHPPCVFSGKAPPNIHSCKYYAGSLHLGSVLVVILFISVEDSQFVVNWEKGGTKEQLGFDIEDFVHHGDGKILKVMYLEDEDGDSKGRFEGMAEEYNRGADKENRIQVADRIIEVSSFFIERIRFVVEILVLDIIEN